MTDDDPNHKRCVICNGTLAFLGTLNKIDRWKCLHCSAPAFEPHDGTVRWIKLNWTGPETWQAYIKGHFYFIEKSPKRPDAWCMGVSQWAGDSDSIMRGVYYLSLDEAQKHCLEYASVGDSWSKR